MSHYRYLIIGGGMTAAAAIDGIRQIDPQGSIGVFSKERQPPYNRPPLTKGLWQGKPLENIWRKANASQIDYNLGKQIVQLDLPEKSAVDDSGQVITYEKLLLATGGSPRRLPFGEEQILYYRTLDDYNRLRQQTGQGRRFAVIGGGFIGSEIAASLRSVGEDVVMLFPEEGIGARAFPADLARFLNGFFQEKGVQVLAGEMLTGMEKRGERYALTTLSGREVEADFILAGIGIRPNTELAEAAGLNVDNGIVVDETLRANDPDVFAAGDVASFYNPALERRVRVEHADNADSMGKLAGQNMAALATGRELLEYHHLPFFYSDLFELGYEAVGELNPQLEVIADWQEPYRKGVVYYLNEGRVRGVLLWNVWDKVDAARHLIARSGHMERADLHLLA